MIFHDSLVEYTPFTNAVGLLKLRMVIIIVCCLIVWSSGRRAKTPVRRQSDLESASDVSSDAAHLMAIDSQLKVAATHDLYSNER